MKKIYLTSSEEDVEGMYQISLNLPFKDKEFKLLTKFNEITKCNYKISGSENMPFEVEEDDDVYDLNFLLEYFEKNSIPDDAILQIIHVVTSYGNRYDLENYEGVKYEIIENVANFAQLAYELYKNHKCFYLPFQNIPYDLEQYIDWIKVGYDLREEGGCIITTNKKGIIILDSTYE
jgi:hypothetical protein